MRWLVGGAMLAVSACSVFTDLSDLRGVGDGGGLDVVVEAPADGFALTVSPGHVTMDPPPAPDTVTIDVHVIRGGSFTQAVNVSVKLPSPVVHTTTPLLVLPTQSSGSFTITLSGVPAAADGGALTDFDCEVDGLATDNVTSATTSFGVHVGSLLVVASTDTSVQVPSFATRISVKAWGAGGGGSESASDTMNVYGGGSGGGGGFASADLPVTPGETLAVWVGGVGKGGPSGGGGGLSALVRGSTPILVAGGGGGGGAALTGVLQGSQCYLPAATGSGGAAGGGLQGETRASASAPGTQTAGGAAGTNATAGTSQQGGHGGGSTTGTGAAHGGGAPGGGQYCGVSGGGGGGGGWFGGGGGSGGDGTQMNKPGRGGGGGSGYADSSATTSSMQAGSGPKAGNTTDAEYTGDAGVGGNPGAYVNCNPNCTHVGPTNGMGGLVIVRLAKP